MTHVLRMVLVWFIVGCSNYASSSPSRRVENELELQESTMNTQKNSGPPVYFRGGSFQRRTQEEVRLQNASDSANDYLEEVSSDMPEEVANEGTKMKENSPAAPLIKAPHRPCPRGEKLDANSSMCRKNIHTE
uniref:Protein translocase subunit SecA n=1 Tax=Lygus hesperus TaxID=30085 RepID=A0A0A9XRD3_LYGHE